MKFNKNIGGEHFPASLLNFKNKLNEITNCPFILENWDKIGGVYPSVFSYDDINKIKEIKNINTNAYFIKKFKLDDGELINILNL